jgi:hypothetical protein
MNQNGAFLPVYQRENYRGWFCEQHGHPRFVTERLLISPRRRALSKISVPVLSAAVKGSAPLFF